MEKTLEVREQLAETMQTAVLKYGFLDHFVSDTMSQDALAVVKDWIQDAGESLLVHRRRGFSEHSHFTYLEVYGVLQAAYIIQDAIKHLEDCLGITASNGENWAKLRDIRNRLIGHPLMSDRNSDKIARRVSIPRGSVSYEKLGYCMYEYPNKSDNQSIEDTSAQWSYPEINLSYILDGFDDEASNRLRECVTKLQNNSS